MLYTQEDLAYVAGLFDGEGCICIKKRKDRIGQYQVVCVIEMNDPQGIQFVCDRLGGKVSISKESNKQKKSHDSYVVGYFSSSALKVLKLISPYLKVKKEQALIAIHTLEIMQLPIQERNINQLSENYIKCKQLKTHYWIK